MKSLLTLTLSIAVIPSLVQAQGKDDYLNWIRQIQTETTANGTTYDVIQDVYVGQEGTDQSPLTIPDGGAIFQLWSMNSLTQEAWLLDTEVVGTKRPQAEIYIAFLPLHRRLRLYGRNRGDSFFRRKLLGQRQRKQRIN